MLVLPSSLNFYKYKICLVQGLLVTGSAGMKILKKIFSRSFESNFTIFLKTSLLSSAEKVYEDIFLNFHSRY
jgi:hypothetical protein